MCVGATEKIRGNRVMRGMDRKNVRGEKDFFLFFMFSVTINPSKIIHSCSWILFTKKEGFTVSPSPRSRDYSLQNVNK